MLPEKKLYLIRISERLSVFLPQKTKSRERCRFYGIANEIDVLKATSTIASACRVLWRQENDQLPVFPPDHTSLAVSQTARRADRGKCGNARTSFIHDNIYMWWSSRKVKTRHSRQLLRRRH